jgi:hypothetical protein
MNGRIFLRDATGSLTPMDETPYDSEDLLQRRLATHPDLLAGYQIDEQAPRRWLFVRREHGIADRPDAAGRWSVDHVFIDQDAIPTLVEVKRSSDTRARREVVAQLLEYAANATSYWPTQELRVAFEARCAREGLDPESELRESLGELDPEEFWSEVESNLRGGKVRLLFAADSISPELQRIVEFLNEQMNPAEVLALEIRQFAGGGQTALVPRILGSTMGARDRKSARAHQQRDEPWDEASFLEALDGIAPAEGVAPAKRLLDWAHQRGFTITGGRGAKMPRLNFELDSGLAPLSLAAYNLWVNLDRMGPSFAEGEPARARLCAEANHLSGSNLSPDASSRGIKLRSLRDPETLEAVLELFDSVLETIQGESRSTAT